MINIFIYKLPIYRNIFYIEKKYTYILPQRYIYINVNIDMNINIYVYLKSTVSL